VVLALVLVFALAGALWLAADRTYTAHLGLSAGQRVALGAAAGAAAGLLLIPLLGLVAALIIFALSLLALASLAAGLVLLARHFANR
jgi:hypothetical protein